MKVWHSEGLTEVSVVTCYSAHKAAAMAAFEVQRRFDSWVIDLQVTEADEGTRETYPPNDALYDEVEWM